MAENKTLPNSLKVEDFIKSIDNPERQKDCSALTKIYAEVTGYKPVMWGPAIIGFGSHHYIYDSGREGDMPLACFSPRKNAMVIYLSNAFPGRAELLAELGKYKSAKACVYISKLSDVKPEVLKKLILSSMKYYEKA